MIRFEQVSKVYSGYHALNSVSFEIQRDSMIFVAGHSGAGKTTILKLIAGIIRPTTGNVIINGQNLAELTDDQLGILRQGIGIVFQDHKLLYDRSVLDNVLLQLRIVGHDRKKSMARALLAIEKVGLKGREYANPRSLSGGEQQRLCIARAVVHRPGILIADEPSANLDRGYALDIMELFKTFHKSGTTVIIAAHDESLMKDYGHEILRFKEGRFES